MAGHIIPKKIYFRVFASLLGLTALTTLAAYVDIDAALGLKSVPMNTIVALSIAICKATLVILFFMHVRYSSHLTRVVVVAGLFWLAILITLTMGDYLTRNMHLPNPPEPWQASTAQQSR
jgi:cytochrome c oxidase subunit IV